MNKEYLQYLQTVGKQHGITVKPPPSRGLGDSVAKLTSALGIKPCEDCKKRQKFLNQLVPYPKAK